MSKEDQIIKTAKEKLEEVFDEKDHYVAEQADREFDQNEYVAELKEKVAQVEASAKTREALRNQITEEVKEKMAPLYDEESYHHDAPELKFDRDEYVAELEEKITEVEASTKTREALRAQITAEANHKLEEVFDEKDHYKADETMQELDQEGLEKEKARQFKLAQELKETR